MHLGTELISSVRAPRRLALRASDALALEMLLQAIELRGLLAGTHFDAEPARIRRKKSGPAAKFQAMFRLLERINARGLLKGTDLQPTWRRVRSAFHCRVRAPQAAGEERDSQPCPLREPCAN